MTRQAHLFAEAECADCLMTKMVFREPSEILYRARLYLSGYTLGTAPAHVPYLDSIQTAITTLRFLECKVEAIQ